MKKKTSPRAFSSVQPLVDEIVVVDTGSTDRTAEIAKGFGAQVYHFEWRDDFSAARNESLRHATKDLIMWLDGDDEIPAEDIHEIKNHLRRHRNSAVYFNLCSPVGAEYFESLQIRAFPNIKGVEFRGAVHEQVYFSLHELGIPSSYCKGRVVHHGYGQTCGLKEKLDRNLSILNRELEKRPDDFSALFFAARTLNALERFEGALEYINKALEIRKADRECCSIDILCVALLDKVSILSRLGMLGEAISTLEENRESASASALIHFMSTPKQELFMARFLPRLETRLMAGIGAAFLYHTGEIKDSPAWMKAAGLQWLHRLLQEPRRLWRRYLTIVPQFLFHAVMQLAQMPGYEIAQMSAPSFDPAKTALLPEKGTSSQ